MKKYFELIQNYFSSSKNEVSTLLGIPIKQAEKIDDISVFVNDRLHLRGQVGALFWEVLEPPHIHSVSLPRFHDEITEVSKQRLMKASCNLMAARFWDVSLTIEDFIKLEEDIMQAR